MHSSGRRHMQHVMEGATQTVKINHQLDQVGCPRPYMAPDIY